MCGDRRQAQTLVFRNGEVVDVIESTRSTHSTGRGDEVGETGSGRAGPTERRLRIDCARPGTSTSAPVSATRAAEHRPTALAGVEGRRACAEHAQEAFDAGCSPAAPSADAVSSRVFGRRAYDDPPASGGLTAEGFPRAPLVR